MEPHTVFVLAIQLMALFSIAGALLLYLICKVRGTDRARYGSYGGGTILVTSADTALGLQLCTHFANKGCRVFAGMLEPIESLPAKLLRGWINQRLNADVPMKGSIIPLQMDVTKEDVMREAAEAMGAHLNAGENGILAVINTAGSIHRGRIEHQDSMHWENMFKTNVLGSLRVARAFLGLLKPTQGRLIYFGVGNDGEELVAYTASRLAIEGCATTLRKELKPYGVSVVSLDTMEIPAESLFKAPIPLLATKDLESPAPTTYSTEVLTQNALSVIESALWDQRPNERYQLAIENNKFQVRLPCRSSFRFNNSVGPRQFVQTV